METMETARIQKCAGHIDQVSSQSRETYNKGYDGPLSMELRARLRIDSRCMHRGRTGHIDLEAAKLDEVLSALVLRLLGHAAAFLAQLEIAEQVACGRTKEWMVRQAHLHSHNSLEH